MAQKRHCLFVYTEKTEAEPHSTFISIVKSKWNISVRQPKKIIKTHVPPQVGQTGWLGCNGHGETVRQGGLWHSRTLFLSRFCRESCRLGNAGSPGLIKCAEETHQEQFYRADPYHFLITNPILPQALAHTAQTLQYQIKSASQGNNPVKTHSRHTYSHTPTDRHTHTAAYSMWSTSYPLFTGWDTK